VIAADPTTAARLSLDPIPFSALSFPARADGATSFNWHPVARWFLIVLEMSSFAERPKWSEAELQ